MKLVPAIKQVILVIKMSQGDGEPSVESDDETPITTRNLNPMDLLKLLPKDLCQDLPAKRHLQL